MDHDFPAVVGVVASGVDGKDHALRSEGSGAVVDELWVEHCRRVHRDFVGAGPERRSHIGHGSDAAAYGQRHEHVLSGAPHDIEHCGPVIARRSDIEKADLISTFGDVSCGEFDRVSLVGEVDEVDALHHATLSYVEARDNALTQHRYLRIPPQNWPGAAARRHRSVPGGTGPRPDSLHAPQQQRTLRTRSRR